MITVVATRSGTLGAGATLNLYSFANGATTGTALTVPTGVYATGYRPSMEYYRGDLWICGMPSRTLRVRPNGQVYRAGLQAPTSASTISASGTGLTNTTIPYLTLVQKDESGVVLQESNASAAGNSLSLSNQGRSWTVPTTSTDSHATHIRGYASIDGGTPGYVWERRLGEATTVTEQVTTAQINGAISVGAALPVTSDGSVDPGARGVLTFAVFCKVFHDRMFYVDPYKPGVYFSKLYEPGSVDTNNDFIPTKDGEQPTGLGVYGDTLLVFCKRSTYGITGFGESDFRMEKLSSSFGCISHHSIVSIQGRLFFAGETGVCTYSGYFRNVMADSLRAFWIAHYAAYTTAYEDSQAIDDPSRKYRLLIDLGSGTRTWEHVGDYTDLIEKGAQEPKWCWYVRARNDTCLGVMSTNGTLPPVAVTGSSDGYVRKPDPTNGTDDGDTYNKTMTITHGAWGVDPGGNLMHGQRWDGMDLFLVNTTDSATVYVYGGGVHATDAAAAHYQHTVAAVSDTSFVKKDDGYISFGQSVPGPMCTVKLVVGDPVGVEYYGQNLYPNQGVRGRGAKS